MDIRKETKWLCENARALEQFSGQWIVFNPEDGVMTKGGSLTRLLKQKPAVPAQEQRFVFHVPSKQDLAAPLIGSRRR